VSALLISTVNSSTGYAIHEHHYHERGNHSSSVSIAIRLLAGDRGLIPSRGWKFFSSPPRPPIQSVLGGSSLGVKRLDREADYSPPSSAEVRSAWCYGVIPPLP
jgi:hypothetical protein